MNDEDFAALLAQVIPVVVLAMLVEARHEHELRIKRNLTTRWNDAALLLQIFTLAFLTFLEVAALITARGHETAAWIAWFAGLPGAIAVGILMIAMGQTYIGTLVTEYSDGTNQLKHATFVTRVSWGLLILAIAAGFVGILIAAPRWP